MILMLLIFSFCLLVFVFSLYRDDIKLNEIEDRLAGMQQSFERLEKAHHDYLAQDMIPIKMQEKPSEYSLQ